MPSVKDALKSAFQSDSKKIENLSQEFDSLERLIKGKQINKTELETQLKGGEVPDEVKTAAIKSVKNLNADINEDFKAAAKIADRVERLGNTDLAQRMRDKIETLGSHEHAQVVKATVRL